MIIKYLVPKLQFQTWINLIVLITSFAIIFGPAFALFDNYDYDMVANPDLKTYLGLAEFDFDQSPVRRYRIIIPFLAATVNFIFEPIFTRLQPWSFPGPDFSLCMSFMLVNSLLMSVFGLLLFHINKQFTSNNVVAFVGVLAILTSRWTAYMAGLPLVDSLYLVITALTVLGILKKNKVLLIMAIFIGPWAKESFIFIAPIIFFFGSINKGKQILYFLLSGIIIFSFRYCFDVYNNLALAEGLRSDVNHFFNISPALSRLFSFHGIYELVSILGIWNVILLFSIKKSYFQVLRLKTPLFFLFMLLAVFVQAILSTELARMFYLASPILAVFITIIVDVWTSHYHERNSLKETA